MERVFLVFIIGFLLISCARVGSPIGGETDSIAPQVIGFNIDSSRVNVPRDLKELRIDFDEYVTLKDIQKNLIISPPIKKIKKILPANLATKFVSIQWEDTLQANTTYSFNFGNSIQDNNEGNPLSYYNFAFSTGEKIDDFYISGDVLDALQISKKADSKVSNVVGLYQEKDTVDYKEKPYYIARVDEDGYFELNYLSPGTYKIIAFTDENGNSVYDSGTEKIGFQKDAIKLDSSISGLKIPIYPSKKIFEHKDLTAVDGGILISFEGNPENIEIKSITEKLKNYRITHRKFSDSVRIWFDAEFQNIGTESSEKLEFSYNANGKQDTVSIFYKPKENEEMTISNNEGNLLPPKKDFKFTSNYVIDKIDVEKWSLNLDSLTTQTFTAEISETNPYQVIVKSDFKEGQDYQLTVPKESVFSFFESNEKGYRFDFKADETKNYGSFEVTLINKPESKFWIQLLNSNEEVAYEKYTDASKIKFDIIKPGEYYLRILVDNNGNEFWDVADFETKTFAEDAYLFYKLVNARPLWEIQEDWDLTDQRKLEVKAKSTAKPANQQNNESKNNQNNNNINTQNNTLQRGGAVLRQR